jgi:hypothetical protein
MEFFLAWGRQSEANNENFGHLQLLIVSYWISRCVVSPFPPPFNIHEFDVLLFFARKFIAVWSLVSSKLAANHSTSLINLGKLVTFTLHVCSTSTSTSRVSEPVSAKSSSSTC